MESNAKEFRKNWQINNPRTIHIPSEHELYLMEEYSKSILEAKIKEIEETRDMITKPSPNQNMPASALTKFGHGFNSGINEAIEILKKGI